MNNLLDQKEINGYRISIYPDYDAQSPCTGWDMAWMFLWEYDRCHKLSSACNKDEVNADSLNGALIELASKNVEQKKLLKYLKKGKLANTKLTYNRSSKVWEITWFYGYKNRYVTAREFEPFELKNHNMMGELLEDMEIEELIQIINDLGEDILIEDFDSEGHGQGDYFSGITFVTKDLFEERVDKNTKNWKQRALDIFEGEKKCIDMWAWGDVKGFVLEKKINFTKTHEDGTTEEDSEWEEIDSCWGYFMESEELIEKVISEHSLNEKDA